MLNFSPYYEKTVTFECMRWELCGLEERVGRTECTFRKGFRKDCVLLVSRLCFLSLWIFKTSAGNGISIIFHL